MKFFTFLVVGILLPTTVFASCITFPRNLSIGMKGDDVFALQRILNSNSATLVATSGDGSPGNESDYFGAKTLLALKAFQQLYTAEILPSGASSTPSGVASESTRTKLSRLSCEIDVARPVLPTSTPAQLGSGLCAPIALAPLPRPKVRLDPPLVYRVHRGDTVSLYGTSFTDNNTVDIGNESICAATSADGGRRIDITIPMDAGLGVQYVRVTDKYGQSNLIKIFILDAAAHDAWSGGCVNITRTLSRGSKGADVLTLQRFLNSDTRTQIAADGIESSGHETNIFSLLTRAGVMSFQKLYRPDILVPAKLVNPNGIIGPLAIKKIRSLSGCTSAGGSSDIAAGAPVLNSIQPNYGSIGDAIVLYGNNFTAENTVLFGMKSFGPFESINGTAIMVTLPASLPLGKQSVSVRTSLGTSKQLDFTVQKSASTNTNSPHITSINPSHIKPGNVISIIGTGFTAATNNVLDLGNSGFVRNGITASSNGKMLTVTMPTTLGAGVLTLQVINENGKSNTVSLIVDEVKVVLPPVIDSVNPLQVKQGGIVSISGHNFVYPSSVYVDGVSFASSYWGGTLSMSLTTSPTMATGTHQVSVKNPVAMSNAISFTVIDKNADAPVIDQISPSTAGSNDTVTISGRNLSGTNLAFFDDTLIGTASGNADGTSATLTYRYVAEGTYDFHLENQDGVSNRLPITIFINAQPGITALSPTSVYPGDAFKVIGKNLTGGAVVINGQSVRAVDDSYNGTTLTTAVPTTFSVGTYKVHVSTTKGDSNELTLTVLPPMSASLINVIPSITTPLSDIHVTGRGLGDTIDLHIGSTVIPSVNVSSGIDIIATLPESVTEGTYQVWATTATGDTNKISLTVTTNIGGGGGGGQGGLIKPMIYSLDPSEISRAKCLASGGVQFTIHGTNFSTTSANVIRSGIGGEHQEVSSDGNTLHFQAGGSAQDALPCLTPNLNPFKDLDIYVYVQNQFGTSDGKIFKMKAPTDPSGLF